MASKIDAWKASTSLPTNVVECGEVKRIVDHRDTIIDV